MGHMEIRSEIQEFVRKGQSKCTKYNEMLTDVLHNYVGILVISN